MKRLSGEVVLLTSRNNKKTTVINLMCIFGVMVPVTAIESLNLRIYESSLSILDSSGKELLADERIKEAYQDS